MKLLILGGTRFLGRHLVNAALDRNHEVTLFNRGKHSTEDIENVETIHGDRNGDLSGLKGRRWDAVIDTSGYLPRTLRASAELLSDAVNRYVFISSQSVYADLSPPGVNEASPLATLTSEQIEEANAIDSSGDVSALNYGKMYGGLKVLCEKVVEDSLPQRTLIIRPGLIVGPYDYTDRFTYWVLRVARGGEVLAPGRPERVVQFINGADLAAWTVKMIEREETGIYNATGSASTMQNFLLECKTVTLSDASFTWVSEDFLLGNNVAAWSEMPLWLPEEAAPHLSGFMFVTCVKAIAAGLTFRPLQETIRGTLAWFETTRANESLNAGISPEREQQLLRKWHDSNEPS